VIELRFQPLGSDGRCFEARNWHSAFPVVRPRDYAEVKRIRHRAFMKVIGWCEQQFGPAHRYETWDSVHGRVTLYDETMLLAFRLRWGG
jgi:hypothetical protein